MKPTIVRNRTIFMAPLHRISKQLAAPLSDELQEKYHANSARVIEGDTVKVLRGEFKGIEGKVTNVSTERRGVAIEGIKREKLKGGNVDLYIHPSNVMITTLNLEDKWRQSRLEGQKPKTSKPAQDQKDIVEKEIPKESPKQKEKPKEQKQEKSEQKDKKVAEKPKKEKQTKTAKSKKSEN